jgi:hypothetical protein
LYSLVSAKAFYKEQPLVDFLCQILNIGVQDLDNPRLFDNKRKFYQLKDAIIGKTVDSGIAACLRCHVVLCCVVLCCVVLCCVVLFCGTLSSLDLNYVALCYLFNMNELSSSTQMNFRDLCMY